MALRWEWNECIGELEIEDQGKAKIRVYQGNALAIFLNEWESKDGIKLSEIDQDTAQPYKFTDEMAEQIDALNQATIEEIEQIIKGVIE